MKQIKTITIEDNKNKYEFGISYKYQNEKAVRAIMKTKDGETNVNIYVDLTTNDYGRVSVCIENNDEIHETIEDLHREEVRNEAFFLNIISRVYGIDNFSTYTQEVKPQSYALANRLLPS